MRNDRRSADCMLFSLLIAAIIAIGCGEGRTSRYQDAAAARRSGDVSRGWLPEYLPDSASGIVEFHFVDGDQSWTAFDCAKACVATLREMSSLASLGPVPSPSSPELRWPDATMIRGVETRLRKGKVYDTIIIDEPGNRAYVWRRSSVR